MKKLICLATLLCCTMLSTAVVAQEASDKSAPKTDNKPTDATKKAGRDRLVIDLFHDNWLTKPDTVKTGDRFGYGVRLAAIGTSDPDVGAPTQMAVFTLRGAGSAP